MAECHWMVAHPRWGTRYLELSVSMGSTMEPMFTTIINGHVINPFLPNPARLNFKASMRSFCEPRE